MWSRHRKSRQVKPVLPGHYAVETAVQLLAPHLTLTHLIKAAVGLPQAHWQKIYYPVLSNYAELAQYLPASEAHHHADTGGLLRHGLEATLEALKLRRNLLLPPGATAEEIAKHQDLWTYAAATCALLHDVGKPISDLVVTFVHSERDNPERWQPLSASLPLGAHYTFRFNPQGQYHRHRLIPPLLVHRILPKAGLEWLASEPAVFDAWLATISGDDTGGPLAAIAHEADGASVARDLSGGVRTRSPAARAKPLSERLLTGLRHMIREGAISLNRPGAMGFVADGSLWLVSKRVLDDLREHLTKEGQTGIPGRNDRLMDELQQWHVIKPNEDKAVWYCNIQIGDWNQALTCLRLDVTQIWSNLTDIPAAIDGAVTPVKQFAGAQSATQGAKGVSTPNRTCSGEEGAGDESYDDLPLPFDLPALTEAPPGEPPVALDQSAGATGKEVGSHSLNDASAEMDIGRHFVAWLTQNIRNGSVEINTVRARLHVLPQGLAMVTPGIFRDFSPNQWDRAQKRFQKLKVHAKTPQGTNIWTCQVAKDRKRSTMKVMLIPDAEAVLKLNDLGEPNAAVTLIDA